MPSEFEPDEVWSKPTPSRARTLVGVGRPSLTGRGRSKVASMERSGIEDYRSRCARIRKIFYCFFIRNFD
jgi:hypothetical protein